jgi:hypothetical protein
MTNMGGVAGKTKAGVLPETKSPRLTRGDTILRLAIVILADHLICVMASFD